MLVQLGQPYVKLDVKEVSVKLSRMRRLLALCCCAVYLAFGFVAGAAHVHESADHHEASGGLHLDHTHFGDGVDHHGRATPDNGEARVDARHVGDHDGDALYLTATARCTLDPGLRVTPATVSVDAAFDLPALILVRSDELSDHLRGPPRNGPTRLRAPPA